MKKKEGDMLRLRFKGDQIDLPEDLWSLTPEVLRDEYLLPSYPDIRDASFRTLTDPDGATVYEYLQMHGTKGGGGGGGALLRESIAETALDPRTCEQIVEDHLTLKIPEGKGSFWDIYVLWRANYYEESSLLGSYWRFKKVAKEYRKLIKDELDVYEARTKEYIERWDSTEDYSLNRKRYLREFETDLYVTREDLI